MEEDKELKNKFGKVFPYKVPEGYFETLADSIMEKLPEKTIEQAPEVTLWDRMKPLLYMAAMFLGLIFGANIFINKIPHRGTTTNPAVTDETSEVPNSLVDPINHMLMIDDYALYQYLTSADDMTKQSE